MSKNLFIAVITLAAGPLIHPPVSHAAEKETICISPNVADAGYTLVVAPDAKTATVSEESFVGSRKIAEMDCVAILSPQHPDSLDNYLACRQTNPSRAPLIARLFAGGIAGLHYASLRTATGKNDGPGPEREIEFGHLECR